MACLLARRAYKVAERRFGSQHELSLSVQFRLADIFRSLGFLQEALSNALAALVGYEKIGGKEDFRLAAVCNLTGWIYGNQGRYEEAEKFCRRALAIREKALETIAPISDDPIISLPAVAS